MPKNEYKEVDYHHYCRLCKYNKQKDYETPCNECLEEFTNYASTVPVFFEPNENVRASTEENLNDAE